MMARLWGQLELSHAVEEAKLGSIIFKNYFLTTQQIPLIILHPTEVNGDVNQKGRYKNLQRRFIPNSPELETFQMSINYKADK